MPDVNVEFMHVTRVKRLRDGKTHRQRFARPRNVLIHGRQRTLRAIWAAAMDEPLIIDRLVENARQHFPVG